MNRGKALAVLTLLVLAARSEAGVIHGRLRLGSPPPSSQVQGTVVEAAGVDQAVVWIDPLPEKVARHYRPDPGDKRVIQAHRAFTPLVTRVMVGSTIDFDNRDQVYHNVFSVSPAQRFDLGKYPPRSSQRVTFEHPGVVNLFCDIHPWMSAYVVVLPHRVFAVPNRAGDWKLPSLPPGEYTLHVWHPSFGERRQTVTVPSRGDAMVALND